MKFKKLFLFSILSLLFIPYFSYGEYFTDLDDCLTTSSDYISCVNSCGDFPPDYDFCYNAYDICVGSCGDDPNCIDYCYIDSEDCKNDIDNIYFNCLDSCNSYCSEVCSNGNCYYGTGQLGNGGGGNNNGNNGGGTVNHQNVINSISGAIVSLNDSVVSTEIGEPMFFWYGQLLNVAIKFFPVVFVVSMFWFIYGYLKNLGNRKSLDSKKSLDNK